MNNEFVCLGACLMLTACGGETRVEPSRSDCQPWRPRGGAWTSLPTVRPPVLLSPAASADGKSVYAIGSWLENGVTTEGLLRSSDLGMTWCVLPEMPESPQQVMSSAGKVLYASSVPDESAAQDVMKSTDGGVTWKVATAPTTGVNTLIVSQQTSAVVWSLSGESVPRISVSSDGMDTWSEVALPPELAALPAGPAMTSLVVDPASPERALLMALVYAVVDDSTRASTDRFFTTDDFGATWREVAPPVAAGALLFTAVADVASSIYLELGKTVFASRDWGQTWETMGPPPADGASLRDLHAPRPGQLFATASELTGNGVQLWQSTDGGASWDQVATSGSFQPWFASASHAGTIVGQAAGSVVATSDRGGHWQSADAVPVPELEDVVVSRVSPFPMWVPSQGVRSDDGGITWLPVSMPGPGRIYPSGASAHDALWVANDGTEIRRTEDGGSTWKSISLDPRLTEIHGVASCAPPHACVYVIYGNTSSPYATAIRHSDDGGRTWDAARAVPDQFFYHPDTVQVAPDDDSHIVGSGGEGLAESKDGGKTWTSQAIDAGSVALLGGGVMLVADSGRDVPPHVTHRTDDGGVTWKQIYPDAGTLFTSPQRSGEVYVVGGNVFRSKDKGVTWTLIEPKSGSAGVFALADAPGGKLIAGVESAGFVSFE